MTVDTAGTIPDLTRGWRLRMSLEAAGMTVQEIADYLGVERATPSRWMHDKGPVARGHLIAWAIRTGVPLQWLETGEIPSPDGGGSGSQSEGWEFESLRARRGKSQRPELVPIGAAEAA